MHFHQTFATKTNLLDSAVKRSRRQRVLTVWLFQVNLNAALGFTFVPEKSSWMDAHKYTCTDGQKTLCLWLCLVVEA